MRTPEEQIQWNERIKAEAFLAGSIEAASNKPNTGYLRPGYALEDRGLYHEYYNYGYKAVNSFMITVLRSTDDELDRFLQNIATQSFTFYNVCFTNPTLLLLFKEFISVAQKVDEETRKTTANEYKRLENESQLIKFAKELNNFINKTPLSFGPVLDTLHLHTTEEFTKFWALFMDHQQKMAQTPEQKAAIQDLTYIPLSQLKLFKQALQDFLKDPSLAHLINIFATFFLKPSHPPLTPTKLLQNYSKLINQAETSSSRGKSFFSTATSMTSLKKLNTKEKTETSSAIISTIAKPPAASISSEKLPSMHPSDPTTKPSIRR